MIVELFKVNLYLSYMAVITIAIIIILKLLAGKRFSARWNYVIWFLLIVRLAVPFSIPSPYSVFELVPQNSHLSELFRDNNYRNQTYRNQTNQESKNGINRIADSEDPAYITPATPSTPMDDETAGAGNASALLNASAAQGKNTNFWGIAAFVWLAGCIALAVFFAACHIRFLRSLTKLPGRDEYCLGETIDICVKRAGLKSNPKVLVAKGFGSPFIFALFKPVVVVPAQMVENLMDRSKEYILLHELMHIKWKDHRINQIMLLLAVLHWFNPFVWLAFRAMKRDCELACDASVLKCISAEEHREYANTLLKIAQVQNHFKLQYSVLAFGESNIKRRIKQIMKFRKSSIGIIVIAALIIAAVSVVIMTGGNLKMPYKSAISTSDTADKEKDKDKDKEVKEAGIFESSKLGLSMVFPEDWEGKYKVIEKDTGITVFFKPEVQIEDGKGILFLIVRKTEDIEEGHIDNVQYFESNGITYITGGPTDATYSNEDPEFDTFVRMQSEVPNVLKTLKSVKMAEVHPKADEYKLSDYFPFEKDVHLKYKGINSEYSEFDTYVDFVTDDTIQIRNNNPGVMAVIVYTLKDGELKRVFNGGEGNYKHNCLSLRNQDEILLKEPIRVGTEWKLKSGEKRTITAVDAEVQTPAGKFRAVEVKTESPEAVTSDYYAKGIGHIKFEYRAKAGDFTVASELEKIEKNVPYVHNMRVYFSDYANDKIVYQDRSIEIKTNEDIKYKFQKELKTPPEGGILKGIISANTQINSIVAEDKSDTVAVDFTEHLVNEMNAGSGAEIAILKCIANTFGQYYQREKVRITIDGKPYSSGHVIMKPGDYLTVDYNDSIEY